MSEAPAEFNHNYHYHRVIFDAIPAGCQRALDVGCGTGQLTRELRRVIPYVTGVDRDERSIEVARSSALSAKVGEIEYRCGDFLDLTLAPGGLSRDLAVEVPAAVYLRIARRLLEAVLWRWRKERAR